jgi:HSP20 family protein
MAKKKDDKEREDFNVDLGFGKLGFGGLFQGIEKLVDLAAQLKDAGGEIKKEGEIDLSNLKEGMKGVFGFSIKTATGGRTVVEPFGNIKKTQKGATVKEEREPITDIFDEEDEVRVYAEMPGVTETDITVELKGDILDISAKSGERKYHKECLIKSAVKHETLTISYKNGILEVRIQKQGDH